MRSMTLSLFYATVNQSTNLTDLVLVGVKVQVVSVPAQREAVIT